MATKRKRRRMPGGSLTIIFDCNRTASFFSRGDVPTDPYDWIADALNALETNLARFHGGHIAIIHGALCLPYDALGVDGVDRAIAGCLETVWSMCGRTAVRDAQARRDAFTIEGSRHIVEAWHPMFTVTPRIAFDADGHVRAILHRIELRVVSPEIRTIAFGVSRLDPVHPPYFVLEIVWKRDEPVLPNIMTMLRLLRGNTEDIHRFQERLTNGLLSEGTSIHGIGDVTYLMRDDMNDT